MKYTTLALAILVYALPAAAQSKNFPDPPVATAKTKYPMAYTDAEWKSRLTTDQYYILREQGTERAFTGKYDHFYQKGP